jgi:hypothetical protein
VRPNWKKSIIDKVIEKSKELETKKIGYSHLDAVTGMLGIGDIDSSLNC